MKGRGRIVNAAYERALVLWDAGPHKRLSVVTCGKCSGVVGRVEATDDGPLLIADWPDRDGIIGTEVSLLDHETEPFEWHCKTHGTDSLSREVIRARIAQRRPKVIIHATAQRTR